MDKKYYTWNDLESAAEHIALAMYKDLWRPNYIVGITRGGLPLATVLSHKISVPMIALGVSLRDTEIGCETNCWLSEWAIGYNDPNETGVTGCRWDPKLRKNILVVDDINDTGATFNWIKKDWESSCFPSERETWDRIWGNSVRFAVMTENASSEFGLVNYYWDEVNKAEKDSWLVYPWEKQQ
jgi:hypoxanthine phosphoribosyltransferase